jgi:hypothetical protein
MQVGGSEHKFSYSPSLLGKGFGGADAGLLVTATAQRAPGNKHFSHVQSQQASAPKWSCDMMMDTVRIGPQRTLREPGGLPSLRNGG